VSLFNTELFIARRIFFARGTSRKFSESIVAFAVFGIAFGLFVMILSVAIVTGFKNEVRNKVIGFGSHIQLVNFDSNSSYETVPVSKNQPWFHWVVILKIRVFALPWMVQNPLKMQRFTKSLSKFRKARY